MTTTTEQRLAIVIPCFNRREITLACIRKLNAGSSGIAIFVSDSASSDGTPEAVVHEPNVRLLHAGASAWWSEAINLGISTALDENFNSILLLNDDIEFETDLLARLIDKHQQNPDAIISPLQQSPTGTFLGIRYTGPFKTMEVITESDADAFVDTTNGCCLLVPRKVFDTIGLIDQLHCPHLYGDTEFQVRAKLAGFHTLASPSIKIKQLAATNYLSRLHIRSLFTFKGSHLHFAAYFQFGTSLFNGINKFIFLGLSYHQRYIKTLIKSILFFSARNVRAILSADRV